MSDASHRLRATARAVGQALVLVAAVDLAGTLLHERASAALIVQVAITEFGAGKLAVVWTAPRATAPTTGEVSRRGGVGVVLGLAAALFVLLVGRLAGSLSASFAAPTSVMAIFVGLLTAALTAARDELLLRGVVLRVVSGWSRGWAAVAACALAAGARVWFLEDTTPQSAIVAAAAGAALACVWLVDKGAWMAVGANTAWIFASATLTHGVGVDVRGGPGPWGGEGLGLTGGRTSALAMGVIAAIAVAWWRRRREPG